MTTTTGRTGGPLDTAAGVLAAGGLVNAEAIVLAAYQVGVPLEIAAALIEKESGGRNIYGHDVGGIFSLPPGQNLEVTPANYEQFLRRVLAGEKSNGVGPAQITYPGYFRQYPDYPFWEPLANIKFGLTLLADHLDGNYSASSISSAGARYNGGTNPGEKALAYGADLLTKTNAWRAKLAGASDKGGSMPKVFLSPSDQDNNPVDGGGNEQQYAQLRCARAAEVLRAHGVTVKVSEAGTGDDSNGYAAWAESQPGKATRLRRPVDAAPQAARREL